MESLLVECKVAYYILLLLLQTTNRKWYMACQIAAICMTLSDLQGHFLLQAFPNVIFSYSSAAVDKIDFNWHSALHGPSAIAELLVTLMTDVINSCYC